VADDDESDEPFENLPTLRSQRRFLEVMSIVSAVYYWFDLRINTESSLLGQSVHVGSTRYALIALWIGLIWAAWRYAQHLYQLWPDLVKKVQQDFRLERSRLAIKLVRRYLSPLSPEELKRLFGTIQGKPDFRGEAAVFRFDIARARRVDNWGKELPPVFPHGPLKERSYSVIQAHFVWMIGSGGQVITFELGIGRIQAAWLWVRAALAGALRRSAVFDYTSPVIMFTFAVFSLVLATTHPVATPESALGPYPRVL
jgi:hypothetical protein